MRSPPTAKVFLALAILLIAWIIYPEILGRADANAQANCQQFAQTSHTLCARFLQYWQQHGGLAQQGYPISEPFSEMSDTDGKIYTVQYFERAVFELHPENAAPNDVLLSLLGSFRYKEKYPTGAPGQVPDNIAGSQLFSQTGKRLGGTFLTYWQSYGGLAQQGYPISDEFLETSDTDGKVYKVQYFERAVFEAHPENQAPYDVLLSQVGNFRLHEKYGTGSTLPAAPGFVSGGLGLSREAWEKTHGPGGPDPTGTTGGLFYEGGTYGVFYTSNDLIGAIGVGFRPSASMSDGRGKSKTLLPLDAQPLTLNQTTDVGLISEIYDTYFSQSLSTLFPPGESALFGGGLNSQYGIWLGARPGTFTVKYDMDITGDDSKTVFMLIYAGN